MKTPAIAICLILEMTGVLSAADKQEHGLKSLVPALACPSAMVLFKGNKKRSWILEEEAVGIAFDDDTTLAKKIRVDEGVDEGLAQRFMGRRDIAALESLEHEGRRNRA